MVAVNISLGACAKLDAFGAWYRVSFDVYTHAHNALFTFNVAEQMNGRVSQRNDTNERTNEWWINEKVLWRANLHSKSFKSSHYYIRFFFVVSYLLFTRKMSDSAIPIFRMHSAFATRDYKTEMATNTKTILMTATQRKIEDLNWNEMKKSRVRASWRREQCMQHQLQQQTLMKWTKWRWEE